MPGLVFTAENFYDGIKVNTLFFYSGISSIKTSTENSSVTNDVYYI